MRIAETNSTRERPSFKPIIIIHTSGEPPEIADVVKATWAVDCAITKNYAVLKRCYEGVKAVLERCYSGVKAKTTPAKTKTCSRTPSGRPKDAR